MTPPEHLHPGPLEYVAGPRALTSLGEIAARFGPKTLVIHGEYGYATVRDRVQTALTAAGVSADTALHTGPTTAAAGTALLKNVGDHASVVAVGGGRVMDTAKIVAHAAGLPCLCLPTSPATCAAATPVTVHYDATGRYERSFVLENLQLITVIDHEVVGSCPNRLLAAGLADALAKVAEVEFALKGNAAAQSVAADAALALCRQLDEWLQTDGAATMLAPGTDPVRMRLAEAAILYPALIGGLAGERAKLAAAHAVHNALTAWPASRAALHGELVAFGILVQKALEGADGEELGSWVGRFTELQCPCSLEALGLSTLQRELGAVAAEIMRMPSLRSAFPEVRLEQLTEALRQAAAAARP